MSAVALLDEAVAFVRASFTRQQVATVRPYAGEFSAAEMPKISYNCPTILITVLGWKEAEAGARMAGRHVKQHRVVAFVLCKNVKSREARMGEAMAISEALCVVLRQWMPMTQEPYAARLKARGVTVMGLDGEATAENMYGRAVDDAGQALWMVDWRQSAKGEIPLGPVRPAVDYDALPALKTVEIIDTTTGAQTPPPDVVPQDPPTVTEEIIFANPKGPAMPVKTDRTQAAAVPGTFLVPDKTIEADISAQVSAAKRPQLPTPALGSVIGVMVAPGQALINNETQTRFEEDKETPQTVTLTTLCRLEDGCLVRVS
jgi:hypothetical protein